jgi:hypothetical protein
MTRASILTCVYVLSMEGGGVPMIFSDTVSRGVTVTMASMAGFTIGARSSLSRRELCAADHALGALRSYNLHSPWKWTAEDRRLAQDDGVSCPRKKSIGTKGTPNARNYHCFYIFRFRVKKLSSTMQFAIIASHDPLVSLTTGLDLREDLVS